MTDASQRKPIRPACMRCWREGVRAAEPRVAGREALDGWHQTQGGWVCEHCWTELERRQELGLCQVCGRDAEPGDVEGGGEWRRRDENGDLICPECYFVGRDSVIVQATKNRVRPWQQAGDLTRYQALVDGALARERKIIIAMLRASLESEGRKLSTGDWEDTLADAVEAARRRWPKPVGES